MIPSLGRSIIYPCLAPAIPDPELDTRNIEAHEVSLPVFNEGTTTT